MAEEKKETNQEKNKEAVAGAGEAAANPAQSTETSMGAEAGAVDAQAAQDKHGDAAQDEDLFKKLIGEHLGEEHTGNSEALTLAKEMYGTAKESGMSHEEAYKCAGSSMKMSALMGKKETAKKEAKAKEAAEAASKQADAPKEAKAKEADVSIAKVVAENAKLKEEIRKRDFESHLEKTLKDSKLPTRVTKVFRESLAPRLKNEKEIDVEFKKFREAFSESDSGRDEDESDGFGACVEKINPSLDESTGQHDGFGDCVN